MKIKWEIGEDYIPSAPNMMLELSDISKLSYGAHAVLRTFLSRNRWCFTEQEFICLKELVKSRDVSNMIIAYEIITTKEERW